jgi:hypothetical protein
LAAFHTSVMNWRKKRPAPAFEMASTSASESGSWLNAASCSFCLESVRDVLLDSSARVFSTYMMGLGLQRSGWRFPSRDSGFQ